MIMLISATSRINDQQKAANTLEEGKIDPWSGPVIILYGIIRRGADLRKQSAGLGGLGKALGETYDEIVYWNDQEFNNN